MRKRSEVRKQEERVRERIKRARELKKRDSIKVIKNTNNII